MGWGDRCEFWCGCLPGIECRGGHDFRGLGGDLGRPEGGVCEGRRGPSVGLQARERSLLGIGLKCRPRRKWTLSRILVFALEGRSCRITGTHPLTTSMNAISEGCDRQYDQYGNDRYSTYYGSSVCVISW